MKSKLNIAFLTSEDPKNRKTWSGIYYQMLKALENQFEKVVPLGPVKLNLYCYVLLNLAKVSNLIFPKKRYNVFHSEFLAKYYARTFKRKLSEANFDVIFAPSATLQMALLETKIPIIYFSDASFWQLKDYYNIFSNLLTFSIKESELIQTKALNNSTIVIHSSKWATDYAITHYGVKGNNAFTITMGANIDKPPGLKILEWRVHNKALCNLLFLGVDWERKGGPIAFNTFLELTKLGVKCSLTVCGCVPPKEFINDKVNVIPFLNKNDEVQYGQFLELLNKTHFLILPTRAECTPIVFAEASAYGIPSISTDTGGVSAMIVNGVNGYCLPIEDGGDSYALLIKDIFTDYDRYKKLVYSSRAKYDNELNWNKWGDKMKEIILKSYKNNVQL